MAKKVTKGVAGRALLKAIDSSKPNNQGIGFTRVKTDSKGNVIETKQGKTVPSNWGYQPKKNK